MKYLSDVTMLYETDHWDVPLCGMCEYRGKNYWYSIDGDESARVVKYKAYELTRKQLLGEWFRHHIFVLMVQTKYIKTGKLFWKLFPPEKSHERGLKYQKQKCIGKFLLQKATRKWR